MTNAISWLWNSTELRIGQVQSKIGEEWNNLDPEKKTVRIVLKYL